MPSAISKQKVYELLVDEIRQNIARLEKGYESVSEAAAKAQGRMESRYDTIKEEQSKLADSIGTQVYEQRERLKQLQFFWSSISSDAGHIVGAGSLVTVESDGGEEIYLIVESGGGRIIEIDDCEIICISIETPVAQALVGHQSGETVEMQIGDKRRLLTIKALQ